MLPVNATGVTVPGVPPGTYVVSVVAHNAGLTSPESNQMAIAVGGPSAPTIPDEALYRVAITGRVRQSGGVTSTFAVSRYLAVTPPLDPLALGVANGPNPCDLAVMTDASPLVGVAGALSFGTNTGFCVIVGCNTSASRLDIAFVTADEAQGVVEAAVDGNVWGLPVARLGIFNIFNATSSVLAQVYQVLTGRVTASFGNGGQAVSGQIALGGASGFSVGNVTTLYEASFTGVRVR